MTQLQDGHYIYTALILVLSFLVAPAVANGHVMLASALGSTVREKVEQLVLYIISAWAQRLGGSAREGQLVSGRVGVGGIYSRSSNGDGDCKRPASPEQPAEHAASAEQPAQCSDELPASLMKCIKDSQEHVVSTLSQRGV